ncbi:MAG: tyrosine-type recombinase/integrase [Solirubrobacteraceae bacterium]
MTARRGTSKESSDDAVGDACLLWAKEQRAIRRPATFVATLVQQRRRARTTPSIVDAVVAHANRLVEERGLQPLPLGITPHKLRHTFASILVAIGRDLTYVMQQLGHTDPAFTLRVYAHAMRRSEEERERLKALVEGHDWAHIGHKTAQSPSAATKRTGR